MATKTFEELKQLAIQIRDEKTNKQNTATRVGTAMLEHINKLEQDYYDKTTINNRTSEYNVSINHPTSGISSSNKYDLSSAIVQVPAELRTAGLKVSFLNSAGKPEFWKYQGGSWAVANFIKEADGGNKILTWITDAATTRKQVGANERKAGMQISYKPDDEDWVNEQYIGTSFTDTAWEKDKNWEKIPKQSEVTELSGKIGDILGTEEETLYDNKEFISNQELYLPTNIPDNTLVEVTLLTDTSNTVTFYAYSKSSKLQTFNIRYNKPISIVVNDCKIIKFYFQNEERIQVKITLLAKKGLLANENKLLYQGVYSYELKLDTFGLKTGDKLLFKNVVTEESTYLVQFYIYKNDESSYLAMVTPKSETTLTIQEGVEKYRVQIPAGARYDSEIQIYLVLSSNDTTNQIMSKPLSDYDFIAAGDSITAWNGLTNTGDESIDKFEGWANLLNAHIGFKTYKNIAFAGASYYQSSVYGSVAFSINRTIKEGLPEGFSGIFTIMGGTNDYGSLSNLGSAEETLSKTYEELDEINNTTNFSTICDGFRYCLETAIRRCSWRARIFVMTCVPRNDRPDSFTVSEMNEQIKLITKSFNIPILDLFSELNLRNGLDQFGETWKLSEVSDDGSKENVHPNAETQKMIMRYVFGKLLTYIR